MSWTVWMDPYESTASFQDTTLFQALKFDSNYVVEYMRCWVVFVGSPNFSNMVMKVYGNNEQALQPEPSVLLETSQNSFSFSDISTQANGIKELWFKFDPFHVKQNVFYNFVLNGSAYFPTASSYIGLEKAYPNPVQLSGYVPSTINIPNSPYKFYPIGSRI